jgi:hypothetical protein
MDVDTRSYSIAGITVLCVVGGVAIIREVLLMAPSEPRGDGMPRSSPPSWCWSWWQSRFSHCWRLAC